MDSAVIFFLVYLDRKQEFFKCLFIIDTDQSIGRGMLTSAKTICASEETSEIRGLRNEAGPRNEIIVCLRRRRKQKESNTPPRHSTVR